MLAVDTNVLMRYLRNDDPRQSAAARALIDEADEPLMVGPEVLAEVYWLMKRLLGKTRAEAVIVLHDILDNRNLAVVDAPFVETAIDAYAQGPAGFVDYLIAAMALSRGAASTFTFDRDAARHRSFRLLLSGD